MNAQIVHAVVGLVLHIPSAATVRPKVASPAKGRNSRKDRRRSTGAMADPSLQVANSKDQGVRGSAKKDASGRLQMAD